MKTEKEIEQMLRDEIENSKRLNKLFTDAVERGDSIGDITKVFIDNAKSTNRIIAFKEVLNHD